MVGDAPAEMRAFYLFRSNGWATCAHMLVCESRCTDFHAARTFRLFCEIPFLELEPVTLPDCTCSSIVNCEDPLNQINKLRNMH